MVKVVNGHHSDPGSTRDLIGITPAEFDLLVRLLQEKYKGIKQVFLMPDESLEQLLNLIKESDPESFSWFNNKPEFKNLDKAGQLDFVRTFFSNDYNLIYKILADINQPYPGANYPDWDGIA